MARRGKIARLPRGIRDELNKRLQDGDMEEPLANWLNGLVPVKAVLKKHFDGRPVLQQNVSAWKTSGYSEWELTQEAAEDIECLRENAERLAAAGGNGISDLFTTLLSARMTSLAQRMLAGEADPQKQWAYLCEMNRQFSRLRRDDHRLTRTKIRQEQWDRELKRSEKADKKRKPITTQRQMDIAQAEYAILYPDKDRLFQEHKKEVAEFEVRYEKMLAAKEQMGSEPGQPDNNGSSSRDCGTDSKGKLSHHCENESGDEISTAQ